MTLNEALILSYIKRGIGYGYNILSHVKNSRSDEWVDFSRAGMYKTLEKFEKTGLVKKVVQQSGSRPPRNLYSITEAGEEKLSTFLEKDFDFSYQARNDLDAFLVTAVAASSDADYIGEKVDRRIQAVTKHIESLKKEWPEEKGAYPFIVYVLYRRRCESLELELKWLHWVRELLGGLSGDILHATGEDAGD